MSQAKFLLKQNPRACLNFSSNKLAVIFFALF
ncbi:hypothetical protein NEOC65_002459 [Neochlamydia sp. AcF65]|nr:hypothetical protein [Neochlamydia sp. AcF65]